MKCKKFGNTWIVSIERGEEVVESLRRFCSDNKVFLGTISGIGATDDAVLGIYDTSEKVYRSTMIKGDHEIANLSGNISQKENEVYLHIHATLSDVKNFALAGHLTSAVISGACEVFITVIDGQVTRIFDDKIGLNMFKI